MNEGNYAQRRMNRREKAFGEFRKRVTDIRLTILSKKEVRILIESNTF